MKWRRKGGSKGVQMTTKAEQTTTVVLGLMRFSVLLHYYYDIYLLETKGQQGRRLLPTYVVHQPNLA